MAQRDLLLPWLSAVDNAALALRIAHRSRTQAAARAAELFGELGLDGFQRALPHELSGGMRQRVAFLRTLLSGKPVLCLDEPFGALDAITRSEMQRWLERALAHAPRTVVLVTHDVEEAVLLADRVAVLSPRPGRVLEQLAVDIARPRARTDSRVIELRESALGALGLLGTRSRRDEAQDRRRAAAAAAAGRAARPVGGLRRRRVDERLPARAPRDRDGPVGQLRAAAGKPAADRRGGRRRDRARAAARLRARRADPPLRAVAPRRLPAGDRLAGRADRGDRAAARLLVGLRRAAQARRDRADLLLPGARHDRRRPRRGRPRPAQAAAHAGCLSLAGVSLRRAARRAAGGYQRRANRADDRRDRRLHRRVADRHGRGRTRASGARSTKTSTHCRRRAPTLPRCCCSPSPSSASTRSPWPSAAWRPGPADRGRSAR